MLGLRFSRLVHAAIAGGPLATVGCVGPLIPVPSLDTDESSSDGSGSTSEDETTDGTTTSPSTTANPTTSTSSTTAGPVEGPPLLLDVQVIQPTTLELYFSEAMGPPTSVDPGLFRLSLAYSNYYAEYYQWGGTFYQDLKQFTGGETCYEQCWCEYYYYDYCQSYYCMDFCYQQPGPPINVIAVSPSSGGTDRLLLTLDVAISSPICNVVDQYKEQWSGSGLFLHYSNNGAPVLDTQGEQLLPIAEHWVLPPHTDYAYEQGYFPAMTPFIPIACPF